MIQLVNDNNTDNLTSDILVHLDSIQSTVDKLNTSSTIVQNEISKLLREQIYKFEIKDNRFIATQDLRSRISIIQQKMGKILSGKLYTNSIKDYLSSFSTIAETTQSLHKQYNDLQIDYKLITPARKIVFEQAKEALYGSGIKYIYKEPINHLLLQQVTTGGSISDLEKILKTWSDGNLSGSKSPTGKPIPNLQQYTTQLARDTSYQFNGTINEIIRTEYNLDGIVYAGDIIKDSRPLCNYLVTQKKAISFNELQKLLDRSDLKPGRISGTTIKNFCTYRGGFGCRHLAFPVRLDFRK